MLSIFVFRIAGANLCGMEHSILSRSVFRSALLMTSALLGSMLIYHTGAGRAVSLNLGSVSSSSSNNNNNIINIIIFSISMN